MKILFFVFITLFTGIAFAETTPKPAVVVGKPKMTAAEHRARREAKIAAEGGLVQRPLEGRVIRLMTKTDKVSVIELEAIAKEITGLLGFAVECVDGVAQTSNRTGCLIVVAEQAKGPTLLVAPEEPWASINVSNLMVDNPDAALLKVRIIKEVWRAFGYAMGAANSNMQPCLMRPIYGLKDLDSDKVSILCPEPLPAITRSAKRLNIAACRMYTYRHACEEGWAPAPTNEVQKAIWEKVHALPTAPIKIKPEAKKVRE